MKTKFWAIFPATIVPILVPTAYLIGASRYWGYYKEDVDRDNCTCACWDTIFKGTYQEIPAPYKHVYFNCTWNTLFIYILFVVAIVTSYEAGKTCLKLVAKKQARLPMVTLLAASIYPHFYGIWMYFNAINDEFYDQIWHQGIFSLTEVVSSICVYQMCNTQVVTSSEKLLTITTVALFHITASASDQFIHNVFHGGGKWYQINRDLGLMTVDLMHLIVAGWYLLHHHKSMDRSIERKEMKRAVGYSGFSLFALLTVVKVL